MFIYRLHFFLIRHGFGEQNEGETAPYCGHWYSYGSTFLTHHESDEVSDHVCLRLGLVWVHVIGDETRVLLNSKIHGRIKLVKRYVAGIRLAHSCGKSWIGSVRLVREFMPSPLKF